MTDKKHGDFKGCSLLVTKTPVQVSEASAGVRENSPSEGTSCVLIICRVCGKRNVCPNERCTLKDHDACEFTDQTWACSKSCWEKHANLFD